jgi:hypothetical protein
MSSTTTTQTNSSFAVNTSDEIPRGPVTATLSYYSPPPDGAKPFNWVNTPPEGQPWRNFEEDFQPTKITDIRGREADFSLQKNAFAALKNIESDETAFQDEERIKSIYYSEVEQLLLNHVPGANRIFLFDHTIRRAVPNAHRAPVNRAHIDQTPASTEARVRLHMGAEADSLLKGRYRIINVWRPINPPVVTHPLAFADANTVKDEHLVGIEHRYAERTGETAGVKFSEELEWHYWSGMEEGERLLLQCFDSEDPLCRVPHSAFEDPRTKGGKPRESIEVRALVFG